MTEKELIVYRRFEAKETLAYLALAFGGVGSVGGVACIAVNCLILLSMGYFPAEVMPWVLAAGVGLISGCVFGALVGRSILNRLRVRELNQAQNMGAVTAAITQLVAPWIILFMMNGGNLPLLELQFYMVFVASIVGASIVSIPLGHWVGGRLFELREKTHGVEGCALHGYRIRGTQRIARGSEGGEKSIESDA